MRPPRGSENINYGEKIKVYIVIVEEWDDLGNTFNDFRGVFSTLEEAKLKKLEIDQEAELQDYAEIKSYTI
ncbi:MAG: hypothetical protein ACFFKA_08955 [Candidatus Thorarchaeota archaeon]